jgi:hypothetical protein
MLVFVYMSIFWISLPHMTENMWPLSSQAWLASLNMMSSTCIHLPSNPCHYSLWLSNTPLCIYHNFLIHSLVVFLYIFEVHALNKYSLRAYCVPGVALSERESALDETEKNPCPPIAANLEDLKASLSTMSQSPGCDCPWLDC